MITIIDRAEKRVVSQIRCSKFTYDWGKESRYVLSPSDNAVCLAKTWEVVEDYATSYEAIEGLLSYYKQEYEEQNPQQALCFKLSHLLGHLSDREAIERSIVYIENSTSFYLVDHDSIEIDRVTLFDVAERVVPEYEAVVYRYGWVWGFLRWGEYEPIVRADSLREAELSLRQMLEYYIESGKRFTLCNDLTEVQTAVLHGMRRLVSIQNKLFADTDDTDAMDKLEQNARELSNYMQAWDEFVAEGTFEGWDWR